MNCCSEIIRLWQEALLHSTIFEFSIDMLVLSLKLFDVMENYINTIVMILIPIETKCIFYSSDEITFVAKE